MLRLLFNVVCNWILVLCVIMLVRNTLVYRIRSKALKELSALAKADIAAGRYDDFLRHYDRLPAKGPGSYDWMMFQITKWRYKDFFPDLPLTLNNLGEK